MLKLSCVFCIVGCFTLCLYGNPADLDTSFNLTGTQTVFFSGGASTGYACTVQPDGKLILVGSLPSSIAVSRLNTDGSLDTSFNVTGTQTVSIGTACVGQAVVLQRDGKILIAGQATTGLGDQCVVVRLNSNGSLDTSFNMTGSQILNLGATSLGRALVVQADRKIVVAGSITTPTAMSIARLNIDGSLDTSFNLTGSKIIPIGTAATCTSLALQHDSKIVMGGRAVEGFFKYAVVRLNTDGSFDTSFNLTGSLTLGFGSGAIVHSVVTQPDGKILLGGRVNVGGNKFGVVRLNLDGSLDTSFNLTGSQLVTVGTASGSSTNGGYLALQKNGNILVGGLAVVSGINQFGVGRLNPDGSFDTTFNTTGTQSILIGTSSSCQFVSLKSDGKIVLFGDAIVDGASRLAVAQLLGDPVTCSQLLWYLYSLFHSVKVVSR